MSYGRRTHLKTWLFKNKCFVKRGQDKEYTHLLLDGGKLHIPRELYTDFYNVLSIDICQGNRNCISENRTEIFRFLTDIDYIDEQPLTNDDIEIIAKKIQIGLELFLRNDLSVYERKIIVCTTGEYKTVTDQGYKLKKTGIHIIWPNVYVDVLHAKYLRSVIIQYLSQHHTLRPSHNPWEEVIDYAVYSSSGLRMKGSSKKVKCPLCKGKKDKVEYCEVCYGEGKKLEGNGRIYMPSLVLDGNGKVLKDELDIFKNDNFEMLKQTSIRTFDTERNIKRLTKQDYPKWFDATKLIEHSEKPSSKRKKKKKKIMSFSDMMGTKKGLKRKVTLSHDSTEFVSINKFIKSLFSDHNEYKDQNIKDIFQCGPKKKRYYVIQTDSQYCQNVCRTHNTNHVWFLLNDKTICQKCFSESFNSSSICCGNYSSDVSPITRQLQNILYPELSSKRKENNKQNQGLDIKSSNGDIDTNEDASIKSFPSISLKLQISMQEWLKSLEGAVCKDC